MIKVRTNIMRTPRGLQVFAYPAAPPEIQNVSVFSGGVHSGTKEADAATTVNSSPRPATIPTITKHNRAKLTDFRGFEAIVQIGRQKRK